MKTDSLRGASYPAVGDNILASLEKMVRTTGSICTVDSIAAARTVLSAASWTASPQYPAYFDINGIMYRANGTKRGDVWDLRVVNETEREEKTYTTAGPHTLTRAQWKPIITSSLPTRPYDRAVTVFATLYGYVSSGGVNLGARIMTEADTMLAGLPTGGANSTTVINQGTVAAGTAPIIEVGLWGSTNPSSNGGTVNLSGDARLNRMVVTAQPITMS
jgi:hypothetical protein